MKNEFELFVKTWLIFNRLGDSLLPVVPQLSA
jgi:hypothetical protein